jgi:phosphocarrier protein HPr
LTQIERRMVEIVNKRGLHARASSKFAMMAGGFDDTRISVVRDDQEVAGDSIMDLLMLAAGPGATIEIRADGPRALEAVEALAALVTGKFGEGE